MTPKEARSLIRAEIYTLRQDQISCKADLSKPHTPEVAAVMSKAAVNAAALTAYHNALNELCGRKTSHEYKDKVPYHPDGGARRNIESIKSEIVWPEKSPVT